MTALNFTDCAIRADERGTWLALLLDKQHVPAARKFVLERKGKPYTAELKEYRAKRSLDANAYLWAMLNDLADALHTTKKELYVQKVREVGVYKEYHLTEDEYKTFRVAWEKQGEGWPVERVDYTRDGERFEVRAYYGSSTYSAKRMSRLLDSVIEDCKAVGVETLPPDKVALLKEDWNAQRN